MRVFVLTTGRSGSVTLAVACSVIENYTIGHESWSQQGRKWRYRFGYPENHIEIDNRNVFFLAILDRLFPDAYWVHLVRQPRPCIKSMVNTELCLAAGILLQIDGDLSDIAEAYYWIINVMVREFLLNKPHATVNIEDPSPGFRKMWNDIGAEGDLNDALSLVHQRHHRSRGNEHDINLLKLRENLAKRRESFVRNEA